MRFVPIFFLFCVAVLLASLNNLSENPNFIPNMIGKKTTVLQKELGGKVVILNVWASWCVACQAEHEVLLDMQKRGLPLYGLNSGDKPQLATEYLKKMGNPFVWVFADPKRELAIELGTTGMPETFVIGKDGMIYYHYRGNLTSDILQKQLLPIYDELIKK